MNIKIVSVPRFILALKGEVFTRPSDKHGLRHRLDGPAVENDYGYKAWYVDGRYIDCKTQEEFEKLLKLKAFW